LDQERSTNPENLDEVEKIENFNVVENTPEIDSPSMKSLKPGESLNMMGFSPSSGILSSNLETEKSEKSENLKNFETEKELTQTSPTVQ
jgi:hypothetical protein